MLSPNQVIYYHTKASFTFDQDSFYSLSENSDIWKPDWGTSHSADGLKAAGPAEPEPSALPPTSHLPTRHDPWVTQRCCGVSPYHLDVSCRIWPVWKIKAKSCRKTSSEEKKDSEEISKVQVLMIFWIPAVCMVLRIIKMKTLCHYSQERNLYRFYDNTTKLHRSSWNMDVLICNML